MYSSFKKLEKKLFLDACGVMMSRLGVRSTFNYPGIEGLPVKLIIEFSAIFNVFFENKVDLKEGTCAEICKTDG